MRQAKYSNNDRAQVIKIGDSKTNFNIQLQDNLGMPVNLSNATEVTLKIGNNTGYLTETSLDDRSSDGLLNVELDSSLINGFPKGTYYIEIWVTDGGDQYIYPSSDYPQTLQFKLNDNIMSQQGQVITEITLDTFEKKFQALQDDLQNKVDSGYFKGDKGDPGERGLQGIQGVEGRAFQIAKTYNSVAEMNASNGDGLSDGDFVMISSNVDDPDNSKLYVWNGSSFVYINDLSGAQGIEGPTGMQGVPGKDGKDAVINVITKAEYDALTDKTGVYFIEG